MAGYFFGDVKVTGQLHENSDRRFKENVAPVDGETALQAVLQLAPKTYRHTGAARRNLGMARGKQYGFIAQDVEKVLPTLVSEERAVSAGADSTAQRGAAAMGIDRYKTMKPLELIPILTKATQQQQVQIRALREEIERLKRQR